MLQTTNSTHLSALVTAVQNHHLPFRAMTLEAGFIIAESAVMGRRMTLLGSVKSMMTTKFCSPVVSRTQMKRSDSSVRVLKEIAAALMPRF